MTGIAELIAGLTTLGRIAKGALDINTQAKLDEVRTELQGIILDILTKANIAQMEYGELLRIKEEAETELVKYENWEKEKEQYFCTNSGHPLLFTYSTQRGTLLSQRTGYVHNVMKTERSRYSNVPKMNGSVLDVRIIIVVLLSYQLSQNYEY